MSTFRTPAIGLCASALAVAAMPALAVDAIRAAELQGYCTGFDPALTTTESKLCAAYISGFLDGAEATDPRVAENVAAEAEEESYSERAVRTRVTRRLRDFGSSVYADYCGLREVPVAEVVDRLMSDLEGRESLDEILAENVVYGTLRTHYPCRAETD